MVVDPKDTRETCPPGTLNPSMKRLSDRLSLCVIQETRGNQYTPD